MSQIHGRSVLAWERKGNDYRIFYTVVAAGIGFVKRNLGRRTPRSANPPPLPFPPPLPCRSVPASLGCEFNGQRLLLLYVVWHALS